MQKKDVVDGKWKQLGWRIEQKYSDKVLVGNWAEERLQFSQECKTVNSSYRLDFRPQTDHRPDVIVRQTALRRSEGLPTRLLFSHHNTPASHYLVTLYDESYGPCSSSGLPKLRTWHTDKMGWVPEKSDHPLHGINPYIVFTTYHHGYEFISEFIASSIQFITNNFHFNR
ncbi:cilia- and flagella-associated protein 107 isoform X4 [Ictalurus punctatus]|uniref:Cilia- and flagella-associated protein 107 isoform X4 n=1 Tax=Ictalurus punctatus TaxID=7998 RepID=A0A9F7TB52_ICTPU|nr:cilia- and flagella-associated protein 107 isoform X4 [Ictalurus punctatus]